MLAVMSSSCWAAGMKRAVASCAWRRLQGAGFEETCRLEDFDWSASITLDRRLLDAVFSLEVLDRHEHVLLVGPAGVGKSFFAQALGYAAVRAGYSVHFSHADFFFRAMT